MPVLNDVKGVYRGSALVKSVTVGTRKIWPSRTITGYRVVSEFTAKQAYRDGLVLVDGHGGFLDPYMGMEDLRVRVKGSSQSLAAEVTLSGLNGQLNLEGNPKKIGISSGTVCELLAPIYST